MKNTSSFRTALRPQRAFTLIEMLVVIAIMALLAGILVPLAGLASSKKILARARIEVDNLDLAINTYKTKKGFYPPDNTSVPAGAFTNQLFYELWGAIWNPGPPQALFTNTFNANETISPTTLFNFFGTQGILNSSSDPTQIYNFIPTLKDYQIQKITNTSPASFAWVFALTSDGPINALPISAVSGKPVNVIRYVSSNPTNNPNTFDLWVDVLVGGKTNRISNWKKEPEIVNN